MTAPDETLHPSADELELDVLRRRVAELEFKLKAERVALAVAAMRVKELDAEVKAAFNAFPEYGSNGLEKAEAVAVEREACARVADGFCDVFTDVHEKIAAAIRARGGGG